MISEFHPKRLINCSSLRSFGSAASIFWDSGWAELQIPLCDDPVLHVVSPFWSGAFHQTGREEGVERNWWWVTWCNLGFLFPIQKSCLLLLAVRISFEISWRFDIVINKPRCDKTEDCLGFETYGRKVVCSKPTRRKLPLRCCIPRRFEMLPASAKANQARKSLDGASAGGCCNQKVQVKTNLCLWYLWCSELSVKFEGMSLNLYMALALRRMTKRWGLTPLLHVKDLSPKSGKFHFHIWQSWISIQPCPQNQLQFDVQNHIHRQNWTFWAVHQASYMMARNPSDCHHIFGFKWFQMFQDGEKTTGLSYQQFVTFLTRGTTCWAPNLQGSNSFREISTALLLPQPEMALLRAQTLVPRMSLIGTSETTYLKSSPVFCVG